MFPFQLSGRILPKEYVLGLLSSFDNTTGRASVPMSLTKATWEIEDQFGTTSFPYTWHQQRDNFFVLAFLPEVDSHCMTSQINGCFRSYLRDPSR
jgi:hypothetical protein